MKNNKVKIIVFAVLISFWSSCMVGEHDVVPECEIQANGLSRAINTLIPADILSQIISLGMPINKGGTPPKIEGGRYKSSPTILLETSVAGEVKGVHRRAEDALKYCWRVESFGVRGKFWCTYFQGEARSKKKK